MLYYNQYVRAESLEEAYDLYQKKNNFILAGMLWQKMRNKTMGTAIDLCGLGLDKIEETEEAFRIGAYVSLRDLETDEDIEKLNELAKRIQNFPDNRMHCKYAAALELESCDGLDLALDIAENLDCYDFDPHIYSPKTYGNYILQEAGVDLQDPAFLNFHFYGYGLRQLGKAGHVCTTYGVIRRNEIPFQHEYTALQPGMKME